MNNNQSDNDRKGESLFFKGLQEYMDLTNLIQ